MMGQAPDHSGCPCRIETPTTRPGWHVRQGPGRLLRRRHGLPEGSSPSWVDHPYRLRGKDGTWTYVAEPYGLFAEALDDLAWLRSQGWHVSIRSDVARHFPGCTVAVLLSQADS